MWSTTLSGQPLQAVLHTPEPGAPDAVVIVIHGMAEYSGRYEAVKDRLLSLGVGVVLFDLPGHGLQAAETKRLGHFADTGGDYKVLADIRTIIRTIAGNFPTSKILLLGHSMGSFLARLIMASDPAGIAACVLSGTTGKNGMSKAGRVLANGLSRMYGPRHVSLFMNRLLQSGYGKLRAGNQWLSRDAETVRRYNADQLCGFPLTVSAISDLLSWMIRMNRADTIGKMNRQAAYLIMSGSDDPLYGPGVTRFAADLKRRGMNAQTIVYEDARHEIFNESNREHALDDLTAFVRQVTSGTSGGQDDNN